MRPAQEGVAAGVPLPVRRIPGRNRVRVWGRTPAGVKGTVVIERSSKGRYRRLRKLRTNSAGIFRGLFKGPRKGHLRARIGTKGEVSVPFSAQAAARPAREPLRFHFLLAADNCPMTHEPSSSNGRVDVSVLVPVLNEEAYIRETVAAMQAQHFDGTVEFLLRGRPLGGRHAGDPRGARARRTRACGVLDNPARTISSALNVGLRQARGEFVVRMDAHAFYPAGLRRQGRRAPAARRRRVGERPRAARRRRPLVGRLVSLALSARGSAPAARASGAATRETRDRHRRLRGRLAPLDARAPRRLGRGLAGQPGLRAGRARARRAAGGSCACRSWPRATCRATPSTGSRASTSATATTARRRRAGTPTACAARTCCRRRSCSRVPAAVVAPRPLRRLARAGPRRLRAGRRWRERPRRAARARRASGRPGGRVRDHARALGLGFLTGCARFGPPLGRSRASLAGH